MSERANLVVIGLLVCTVMGGTYFLLSTLPTVIFGTFLALGYVIWYKTRRDTMIATREILVPYVLTVMCFIVHVAEEHYTGFPGALSELMGTHVSDEGFLFVAAFAAPLLWLSGLLLLHFRIRLGEYVMWCLFAAMIVSEQAHYIFPLMQDGTFHYFPGMVTASLPLIPAAVGVRRLLKNMREQV